MNLIQMSVTGALMIAAVLLIRALGLNRLPKRIFLVLWAAALLRLLLPVTFPSPFPSNSLSTYAAKAFAPPLQPAEPTASVPPAPSGGIAPPLSATASAPALAGGSHGFTSYPWKTLALVIWGAGIIVISVYFCIAYFRFRRQFMHLEPVDNGFLRQFLAQQPLKRIITVRQSDTIPAPLTYGLFRPVILLPGWTDWSDTRSLRCVLTHECIHIRRFDGVAKFLLTVCLCLHWFNPLVWAMYIMANRDIELACDEAAVRLLGTSERSAYALTLVGMEEQKSGFAPFCSSFRGNAVEERIRAIMRSSKTSLWTIAVGTLAIAALLTAFTVPAAPDQAPQEPPPSQSGARPVPETADVRVSITSAAVQILPAHDNVFSAEYDSETYDVSITQEDGLSVIEISGRIGNHSGIEPVKLYWPELDYGYIRMDAQYASLECNALKSGNITATFDSSSVIYTLPQEFSGMLDASADDSYFHLLSDNHFRNSNATVICSDNSCNVPAGFQWDSDSSAYTYADGTQENEIRITTSGGYTMIGDSSASLVVNRFVKNFMDGLWNTDL